MKKHLHQLHCKLIRLRCGLSESKPLDMNAYLENFAFRRQNNE